MLSHVACQSHWEESGDRSTPAAEVKQLYRLGTVTVRQ
jgi:hypothetical protein